MSELKFVPIPDPRFPETLTPENIATLQAWGVIPQEIFAVASREHWGSQPGFPGTFPEEGLTPKYWWPREAVESDQDYLYADEEVHVYRSNSEPGGFSHPTFKFYGVHTSKFYRDYAPLFDHRVPVMVAITVEASAANRKNVKQGMMPVEYPIGAPRPGSVTGWSFPTDCALRFRPGTQIVEAFRKEDFIRHFGDPAKYDKPAGVMAAPETQQPAPATPPVVQQPPAQTAPPASVPAAHGFQTYEGMELNMSTGEAIVNGIQTGWYFERPTQIVPLPENPETGRQNITVKPWGFATASTAQRVLELLQVHTQLNLEIFKGEQDGFHTSVPQRYIGVSGQPKRVGVNAGMIAEKIARTTCEVSDGKGGKYITHNPNEAVAGAITALQREME